MTKWETLISKMCEYGPDNCYIELVPDVIRERDRYVLRGPNDTYEILHANSVYAATRNWMLKPKTVNGDLVWGVCPEYYKARGSTNNE